MHNIKRLIFISILLLSSSTIISCDKKETNTPPAPEVEKAEVISEKWLEPLPLGSTLEITAPDKSNYLLTKSDDGWTIKGDQLGPKAIPLRGEYSQQLEKIFGSPVTRVPKTDPTVDRHAAELTPEQRYTVALKSGTSAPITFYVGKTTEDPNSKESRTYILTGDGNQLFQANNNLGSFLHHSPFELRNNEVLRLDPDKIIKIESDKGTQAEYQLERRGDQWVNALHPDQPLELSLINGIKRQLNPLDAIQYLPDNTSLKAIPEDDKRTFIVSDSDGGTHTLLFAKSERNGIPIYLVKEVGSGKVASLSETPLSYAFLTSADLRERRPRTFPIDSIKEIRFPGAKPVVVRPNVTGDGIQWNQIAPEKGGPLQLRYVQNSINKAATILPVRMSDATLEEAGLTPVDPSEILEIRLKDGTRKQLVFGKETERKDGRYVVWQDTTDVFVLSDADSKNLHPGANTFLN